MPASRLRTRPRRRHWRSARRSARAAGPARFALADVPGGGVAVHHRHLAVHQHEVDRLARRAGRAPARRRSASMTSTPSDCSISSRDHAVDLVVLDDQHPARPGPRRRRGRRARSRSTAAARRDRIDRQAQREAEARAAARLALDLDLAAHRLDDALADRQPEPGAAAAAGCACRRPGGTAGTGAPSPRAGCRCRCRAPRSATPACRRGAGRAAAAA